jgi:hypothetical protein
MNTFYDLNGNEQANYLFSNQYTFITQFGWFFDKTDEEINIQYCKYESHGFPEYIRILDFIEMHCHILTDMFQKLYFSCAPIEWYN